MTFVSYAQNFEDVLLWRALGHVADGFYVDVGAAHPDIDSVTRAFYDRGWRGLDIEPVAEYATRLRAARPRDVILQAAIAETGGEAEFFVLPGTGLSTLATDIAAQHGESGFEVQATRVELRTLAAVCRAHAPRDIHFLKVDVEGAERAVLASADFAAFRPWVVLVEATAPMSSQPTHAEWEPILLAAGYRFLWFDGLNRFYAAAERHAAIAPHFATPPNVFDDFIRAADTEWARRVQQAESRAALAEARAGAADGRREAAEAGSARAQAQIEQARETARRQELEVQHLRAELAAAGGLHAQLQAARHDIAALRASTSWRVTAPLRAAMGVLRPAPPPPALLPPSLVAPTAPAPALPEPAWSAPWSGPARDPAAGALRAIHQFHSGSAVGDAITNAMLLTRGLLRGLGYRSEIYVEHPDPGLAGDVRPMRELPRHDGYVLILRHSMGYAALSQILELPAPKVLLYHNITPPEFLATSPDLQRHARLGRTQLQHLRPAVRAALADSEYNALELRGLGFDPVQACTLLFDLDRMGAAPASPPDRFTMLFVGRVMESKGQAELVDAFARFRAAFRQPCRLVLVGRTDGISAAYKARIEDAIAASGLQDDVVLTGLVSDAERDAWYGRASLYVSLSRHEGFGVPLVEAVARGVPVLAWPCGAVPYTLGDPAGLLEDRGAEAVAARLLELARDPAGREALHRSQHAALARFRLEHQVPILLQALALAGAAPPDPAGLGALLGARMRFTVAGHVNGSYSLAAINRDLALAIEAARPGTVRVQPVEGAPTEDLSGVPEALRPGLATLAARPVPPTGPHVVISQHYPVWVPPEPGDAALACFFWEESLVPAATVALLNGAFRAVLAPSAFVAKALVDSGLAIPVHVVGLAPDLAAFRALAAPEQPPGQNPREAGERREGFTFLHVSSCFPRKGVDVLLAAWARAFRRDDPVRLVIKGFPNPHNDVSAQLDRLRADTPDLAPVTLLDRDMEPAELLGLYAAADALVLPTRGEGFNLPAAEAMEAGLPLIVTGHGGHMDFCDAATARLVAYRFAPSRSHLATPHSVWAEPDEADLAAALQELAQAPRPDRTRRARAVIAARCDPDALVRRVVAAAVGSLLAPPARPPRLAWISSWGVRCGVAEYSRHLVAALAAAGPGETVVLADARSAAEPPAVWPCWRISDPDSLPELATAVAATDPDLVVIQHQPGLMGWPALAALLGMPALRARPVAVTLHNTRHLAELPEPERAPAVAALAGVARVLVHTVADLNLLKTLGLVGNVTLLPHGAPPRAPAAPARTLRAEDTVRIGCYGFFLPGKGIQQLIAALARLRDAWPRARLILVNAEYDHPDSAREIAACREEAGRLGLGDEVEWHTEFLPHARSLVLLGACDLIALPYQGSKEASSAALRTALSAGPPVAVTPIPIFDEAEEATLALSGTDPAAIAAGLGRMLADWEMRRAAQEAAAAWIEARDWAGIGVRLHGMLRGLRASAGSGRADPVETVGPLLTRA